uniref:Phage tail tube protein n=1 Tax=Candidatus Kentrum sp. LFY TaxID=2126342 RepID=A0A450WI46_9GAMM|nr:MAG: Protein of unknown function (DUF2597) [Candidatus Kentron sp. LFY]
MAGPMHVSGSTMEFSLGGLIIRADNFSLTIEDGMKAVTSRGIPHGWVDGEVSAKGDIEVDTENFNLIVDSAKSFQELEAFDIDAVGKTPDQELRIQAFGCKLSIADLLSVDANGGDKLKHKIGFQVTDDDFVRINGKPYLAEHRTKGF